MPFRMEEKHMNQTYRILPVCTSDVSGVCSALYELGGLVVMHDPSGCNSTYNTHDEIRWYEQDSLIFISGLTERDAMMGNDEKFYRDILEAAREFRPEFIAVTNSPVPYLTGTDFPALMRRMEKETGIPSFYVPANGMHDYTMGAGRAFQKIAQRLVEEKYCRPVPGSINILGMTPLDYAAKGSAAALRAVLEDGGYRVSSVWAMGDSLEHIRHAGEAALNLVVSSAGLFAAQVLKQRFGTPYVIGTPVGGFKETLLDAIGHALKTKTDAVAYHQNAVQKLPVSGTDCLVAGSSGAFDAVQKLPGCGTGSQAVGNGGTVSTMQKLPGSSAKPSGAGYGKTFAPTSIGETKDAGDRLGSDGTDGMGKQAAGGVTLIGEPVLMGSLAAAIRLQYRRSTRVLCPTEISKGLLTDSDKKVRGEEETQALLQGAGTLIADPLYRWICPPDVRFYPLPSLALSGRMYLREMNVFSDLEVANGTE